jgi:hypothetical protein
MTSIGHRTRFARDDAHDKLRFVAIELPIVASLKERIIPEATPGVSVCQMNSFQIVSGYRGIGAPRSRVMVLQSRLLQIWSSDNPPTSIAPTKYFYHRKKRYGSSHSSGTSR